MIRTLIEISGNGNPAQRFMRSEMGSTSFCKIMDYHQQKWFWLVSHQVKLLHYLIVNHILQTLWKPTLCKSPLFAASVSTANRKKTAYK